MSGEGEYLTVRSPVQSPARGIEVIIQWLAIGGLVPDICVEDSRTDEQPAVQKPSHFGSQFLHSTRETGPDVCSPDMSEGH